MGLWFRGEGLCSPPLGAFQPFSATIVPRSLFQTPASFSRAKNTRPPSPAPPPRGLPSAPLSCRTDTAPLPPPPFPVLLSHPWQSGRGSERRRDDPLCAAPLCRASAPKVGYCGMGRGKRVPERGTPAGCQGTGPLPLAGRGGHSTPSGKLASKLQPRLFGGRKTSARAQGQSRETFRGFCRPCLSCFSLWLPRDRVGEQARGGGLQESHWVQAFALGWTFYLVFRGNGLQAPGLADLLQQDLEGRA